MSNPFSGEPTKAIGVDAGATLCKLARGRETLETGIFPSTDVAKIRRTIEAWGPDCVVLTGGGAERLGATLGGVTTQRVPEFHAWSCGAPILADFEGIDLPDRYLLVSLGTGTSILAISEEGSRRVGGSALGGGTLLGLGCLLLRVDSFEELTDLAAHGDRREVDLLVGDIYGERETPLPPQLNAASFAKLASREPADLAHALFGLVGENVGLICGHLAQAHRAEAVIYCGSTLLRNPALAEILATVTGSFGTRIHFLSHGAFCGAVGAASLAQR